MPLSTTTPAALLPLRTRLPRLAPLLPQLRPARTTLASRTHHRPLMHIILNLHPRSQSKPTLRALALLLLLSLLRLNLVLNVLHPRRQLRLLLQQLPLKLLLLNYLRLLSHVYLEGLLVVGLGLTLRRLCLNIILFYELLKSLLFPLSIRLLAVVFLLYVREQHV